MKLFLVSVIVKKCELAVADHKSIQKNQSLNPTTLSLLSGDTRLKCASLTTFFNRWVLMLGTPQIL